MMANELPEERAKLVQKLWKNIVSCKINLHAGHYDALLATYSENGVNISPEQFLADMIEKRCHPTRYEILRAFAN